MSNFLSLQKAELSYEVALRGGTSDDSVQDLRKQIVKLAKELPSESILESHLEPDEDLKQLIESLTKSQNNLSSLKKQFDKNLYLRTEVLIHHMQQRLNRINATEKELHKTCTVSLAKHTKTLNSLKPSEPSASTSTTQRDIAPSEQPVVNVSCDRNLNSEIFKLKFNGKTCVRSFIQKIQEFVESRNITYEKLLSYGYEIFTDDALHWYRQVRSNITSWEELCKLLKTDFSQSDYDYRLFNEIRARTQGEHENISIYIAIMHGMFSRLSVSPSEEDKLEILLHNVRPTYASTLAASPTINTINDLKSICKNFENIQSRSAQFHEPPQVTSQTLAPEFAYKNNTSNQQQNRTYTNNNTHQTSRKTPFVQPNRGYNNFTQQKSYNNNFHRVAAVANQTKFPFTCPRCRTNNHDLYQCKAPRTILCFQCGKKDVRLPQCPVCNPNKTDNSSKN